jgi:predicted metal-dependent hydrolase
LDDVEDVLKKKQQWILETLYGISEQQDPPLDKEYLSGEKLLYNGRRYWLKVKEESVIESELRYTGNRFERRISTNKSVSVQRKRQAVVDWYIDQAEKILPEHAERFIDRLGASDVEIVVQELYHRWGEFKDFRVTLHWRLVLTPKKIQDYVIAHELAHIKHDEHSDAFWNTVGTLVPDYRDRREWLHVKGATLRV